MRWSVTVVAEGDRELGLEEIVELADAVAASSGVASGVGTTSYGARLLVTADTREQACERGRDEVLSAAARAGLPDWPVVHVAAVGEDEDLEDADEIGGRW